MTRSAPLIAEYTIEFHGRGGPYRSFRFGGTRREAKAKAIELIERDSAGRPVEGYRLHFHRYLWRQRNDRSSKER